MSKKILVAVKRVVDYNVKIRVNADESGVDLTNIKMAMNPFDEIAIEEAVRLKEAGIASEIIAVSIGPQQCQETLRAALALGADSARLIVTDETLAPLSIAKILQKLVVDIQPDLILLGKQSIDGDHNQTGQMLAALLQCAQGTFISKLVLENEHAVVTREVDGGLETLKLTLPAVLTTDLRLNEPRYASLPNIMKAKKKPLDMTPLADLGLSLKPHVKTLKVSAPPVRKGGMRVQSVDELIAKLREAGVLQ